MIEASTDTMVQEAEYPHPIEVVWKALTDREALSNWLMPNDFAPEVGHKFQLTDPNAGESWSGVVECEVLELNEPNLLRWSWSAGFPSTLTIKLEATADGGTRVEVTMSGFDAAGDFGKQARGGAVYFWGQKALKETLPQELERLAGARS